jgi:hypothetical protein
MILAKPVVANKYWILRQDDRKVGEIESRSDGFYVKINNSISRFNTQQQVRKQVDVDFLAAPVVKKKSKEHSVSGFPTDCKPHNPIYNIQEKLPLYTRTAKSKSWYAAGWYLIKQHGQWREHFCPKLITLQRYKYQGPVQDPQEFVK